MSDEVERRLVAVLSDVDRSPFGNPIPGLKELGVDKDTDAEPGTRAIDVPENGPVEVTIALINEILQVDSEQFSALMKAGITVGTTCTLENKGGRVFLTHDGHTVELVDDLAHAVRVNLV